jgi:hypothetical protein
MLILKIIASPERKDPLSVPYSFIPFMILIIIGWGVFILIQDSVEWFKSCLKKD